ncbi:TraR/DksA C4-type zinc finger protein [Desulfonatronovibrio hydrogenovorans]|uniref:TraR/DksA C4-type zinc finger protein n=1 Tax=Desulfonatronovibrio hydrogenovorans TaxID=53245 RepID=UPI0004905D7F|nr:TraR/DksA C4-type zinc finger protein [Desulfonatronovibrio hydrogenovorans]
MADIVDRAQQSQNFFMDQAQAEMQRRLSQARAAATNNTPECIECGDMIPKARRAAVPGCLRCIECQREVEDGLT